MSELRDEYAKRALSHVSRLTARERYYIEGFYYCLRPETRGARHRSVSAGAGAASRAPCLTPQPGSQVPTSSNDSRKPSSSTRELVRRGTTNPTTLGGLAQSYLGSGDAAHALSVIQDLASRTPENASALTYLGAMLVANGRLDDARAAFGKSVSINPRSFQSRLGAMGVAALQNRWADVQIAAREFGVASDAFQRSLNLFFDGEGQLLRGRSREAIPLFERAASVPGTGPADRTSTRRFLSAILLRMGRPADALAQAERAAAEGQNTAAEFETLEQLAIAQSAAGRHAEAEKSLARLESRATILPSPKETRRVHFARGSIALARGDAAAAVAELSKAEGMLPINGPPLGPPSSHAAIWYAVALAHIKAGRDADAASRLERLQSRYERMFDLDAYVRSFYVLGQIYDRRGDAVKAREQFARFIDLRGDGDLDRDWIADARKKIAR